MSCSSPSTHTLIAKVSVAGVCVLEFRWLVHRRRVLSGCNGASFYGVRSSQSSLRTRNSLTIHCFSSYTFCAQEGVGVRSSLNVPLSFAHHHKLLAAAPPPVPVCQRITTMITINPDVKQRRCKVYLTDKNDEEG